MRDTFPVSKLLKFTLFKLLFHANMLYVRTLSGTYPSSSLPAETEKVIFEECTIEGSLASFFNELNNLVSIDFTGLKMKPHRQGRREYTAMLPKSMPVLVLSACFFSFFLSSFLNNISSIFHEIFSHSFSSPLLFLLTLFQIRPSPVCKFLQSEHWTLAQTP